MSRLEVMSTRTFSRPAFLTCLAFNPLDLYYLGYNYIIIIIMWPSSLGGGRILRRTLSVRLSVCLSVRLSVRPSRYRYRALRRAT